MQGFYDPKSKLVFRALAVKERRLDDALIDSRLQRALQLRQRLFKGSQTTGVCATAPMVADCRHWLEQTHRLSHGYKHQMLMPTSYLAPYTLCCVLVVASEVLTHLKDCTAAYVPAVCLSAGYRLINGEGDLLPGLVCDVYGDTAVLKLDGEGPAGFYDVAGIAEWLQQRLPIDAVFHKNK